LIGPAGSIRRAVLAGLEFGQQLLDGVLHFGGFRNKRVAVPLSCNITICFTL
jgi:hypothetical protein